MSLLKDRLENSCTNGAQNEEHVLWASREKSEKEKI